jgi:hypothetical protein
MVPLLSDGYECPYYLKIFPRSDGSMGSPAFFAAAGLVAGHAGHAPRVLAYSQA